MGHCWWLAIQGLSIPDEGYSPPYPEPDALPHRFSSQSYPVCPANPFLSHLASAPCYSIFLLISAGLPTPIFGVSSRVVPSSPFLWTQPLRAAVSGIILLWPTLEHVQCTGRTSGAKIKMYESLKAWQIWIAFRGNCKRRYSDTKFSSLL